MAVSLITLPFALLAGLAGATLRRARQREAAAEKAYPPRGTLLRIDGRIVHAETAGEGPDLILLHGASGNAREFTFALMDRLKARFRVTAFDRPGLGWSEDMGEAGIAPAGQVAALRAAARRLGLSNPLILGQSYGGAVALSWALEAPGEVAGLIIVSGASNPWPGGLGGWYRLTDSRLTRALVIPFAAAWTGPRLLSRVVQSIFAPDPAPEGYADHIAMPLTLRRAVLDANARQVNGLLPHIRRMAPRYPTLDLPVEILHGTADTIVPLEIHAEPLARQIPGAVLTRLDGVGHMPHHTRPDEVIAAIDRAAARAGLL